MSTDITRFLEDTFQLGECTCMRCRSDEPEENYSTPHNFKFFGVTYSRKFANSRKEQFNRLMFGSDDVGQVSLLAPDLGPLQVFQFNEISSAYGY